MKAIVFWHWHRYLGQMSNPQFAVLMVTCEQGWVIYLERAYLFERVSLIQSNFCETLEVKPAVSKFLVLDYRF